MTAETRRTSALPTIPAQPAVGGGDVGDPILRIAGLRTHYQTTEGVVRAVDGVDLEVAEGRTMCVVGESGCGKSVTARSILRLIDPPGRIVEGTVNWRSEGGWTDLAGLDPRSERLRHVRGSEIGMVFQEPMASLSPMYTVGAQLVEAIKLHHPISDDEAADRAIEQLARVGIPQPKRRFDSYPFELSGGMCQRVMIAIALSCQPALLIADEPTTALDVTTQARILDLLKALQAETGMALVFITHDLGVVAEIADEVTVMYLGTVVERGSVAEIFDNPRHPYTRALLRSVPTMRGSGARRRLEAIRGMVPHPQNRPTGCPFHTRCDDAIAGVCDERPPPTITLESGQRVNCHLYDGVADRGVPAASRVPEQPTHERPARAEPVRAQPAYAEGEPTDSASRNAPLVRVEGLVKHFPLRRGFFGRSSGVVRAVDGVDLSIRPGETLGLVGESGCGKTTLGRCLARVENPTAGRIEYRTTDCSIVDLTALRSRELRRFRGEIRVIFQDPFSSLNPRMTLEQLVGEPLRANRIASGSQLRDRVADALTMVGLRPEYMRRYPHAFSGGERQRINIARALVTNPRLVIADEAVSALDVSVRAQILNLLADLQERLDLTYLFISHDLSVVEHLCDRVTVMYLGRVAESTETATLYREPHHPYTEALLHAVPLPDPHQRRVRHAEELPDDLPDPALEIAGCPFHTRCPHARSERCGDAAPALRLTGPGHHTACHYAEELSLRGISG